MYQPFCTAIYGLTLLSLLTWGENERVSANCESFNWKFNSSEWMWTGNRHLCLPSKFTRSFPLFTEKPALWRNVEASFFSSHLKKPFNRNLPLSSFEWKAGIGGRNYMQSSPGRYFLSVCHASPSPSTIETSDRIKTTISFPQRKNCSL